MSSQGKLVRNVGILSLTFGGAVALVMGFLFGFPSGISSAVGTLIGFVNLWALTRLIVSLMDDAPGPGRKGRAAVLLGLKMVALVTIVWVLIYMGWVRGGSLMAGLSVVAMSILLAALLQTDEDTPNPGSDE